MEIELMKMRERKDVWHYNQTDNSDAFVPMVQLLIDGDHVALKYAHKAVERKIPVVVVKDSGGFADLICWCISRSEDKREFNENDVTILKQEIKKILDDIAATDDMIDDCVEWLQNICGKYREHIFIYDASSTKKLSELILSIILEGFDSIEKKFDFLLQSNCWHLAEEILKTQPYESIRMEHLNRMMMRALRENKHEFVQMLLNQKMNVQFFLSDERLESLYAMVFFCSDFYFSLRVHTAFEIGRYQEDFSNSEIRDIVISKLTDGLVENFYKEKLSGAATTSFPVTSIDERLRNEFCNTDNPAGYNEQDLFIWAILYNRIELALIFWKLGRDHISSALIAVSMFTRMAALADKHDRAGLVKGLQNNASVFENIAIELLSEAHESNKWKMEPLLLRELPSWGGNTCLKLAWQFQVYKFLHHPACQSELNSIWMSPFPVSTSNWNIFLHCIGIYKFKEKLGMGAQSSGSYSAPVVKFAFHVAISIFFLLLLTYFNLFHLKPRISVGGSIILYAVFVWFFILVIFEICQVLNEEGNGFLKKWKQWSRSHWNKIDLVIFINYFVCVLLIHLSLPMQYFEWCRMAFALWCSLYYIRFLQFFYAFPKLGTKVLMVYKMLNDIKFFVCIYVIFIMAYGTMKQTLLNPYQDFSWSWNSINDIFKIPYWQTYGELHLESFDVDITCRDNGTSLTPHGTASICWYYSTGMARLAFAVFILVTNILLINMLIALLSQTVSDIQASSAELWSYYRYGVVKEFDHSKFIRFLRKIYVKFTTKSQGKNWEKSRSLFKITLDPESSNEMSQFEYYCMKRWDSEKRKKEGKRE